MRRDIDINVGVLGTFSEIVHSVSAVSHVVGPDTLQEIFVRETTKGHLSGAAGTPGNSEPCS